LDAIAKTQEDEQAEELVPLPNALLVLRFPIEFQNPLQDHKEFIDYGKNFEDNSMNLGFGQVQSPQTSDPYDYS